MRYRLLRRCTLERIDTVVFPPYLREAQITNRSGAWTVLATSNSYDTLFHIMKRLYPQDDFKIIDMEVPTR